MATQTDEQIVEELRLRQERGWSLNDHPNSVRAMSIAIFLTVWEFFGRRTDPILFTYPTAIGEAFWQLLISGELIRQLAVSLGGTETLASHPASMMHSGLPAQELARYAIRPGLIRVSIGLEDPEDLIADLSQALDQA